MTEACPDNCPMMPSEQNLSDAILNSPSHHVPLERTQIYTSIDCWVISGQTNVQTDKLKYSENEEGPEDPPQQVLNISSSSNV